MLAYLYDKDTKEYIASMEAQKDPLESKIKERDVYLLPINATFTKPVAPTKGFSQVWNGSSWDLVVDERGKRYVKSPYDRQDVFIVENLGQVEGYFVSDNLWKEYNSNPRRYFAVVNNELVVLEREKTALEKIKDLEEEQTPRLMREYGIDSRAGKTAETSYAIREVERIDAEIAELRKQL